MVSGEAGPPGEGRGRNKQIIVMKTAKYIKTSSPATIAGLGCRWCKNLITQTFNSAEVIMKIAKRNGKENSKYWHY